MFKLNFKHPSTYFILGLITLFLTFLAYSNIFQNELIGDDIDFISNWSTTHNLSGLPKLMSGDLPSAHLGTYRPIRSLLYLLTYQLWAGNVFFYHVFSLSTHLLITFLVITNVKLLTKNKWIALSSGLLFGLHPIHTEAVTFITASFDTVAFAFLLTSLFLFQQYKNTKQKKSYYLSIVFSSLAFFTNEQTLIFPVIILAYSYFFETLNKKTKQESVPYFAVAGLYLFIRFVLLRIVTRGQSQFPTYLSSVFTSLKALLKYLQTLIFPADLNIAHTLWGDISTYTYPELNKSALLSQKITETPIILTLTLVLLVGIFIYKKGKKHSHISFSLIWIFAFLLPVLNFFPSSLIYAERYAYLPSMGFVLLVPVLAANLLKNFLKNKRSRIIVLVCSLSLVSIYYTNTTYKRNQQWQNEITFWNSAVEANPQNPTVYFQLGQVHFTRNHLEEAKQAYQKTVELEPHFTKAYYSLGLISQTQENWPSSVGYLQIALEQDPNNQLLRHTLARLYAKQAFEAEDSRQFSRAIAMLNQAISVDPGFSEAITKRQDLCLQSPQDCR